MSDLKARPPKESRFNATQGRGWLLGFEGGRPQKAVPKRQNPREENRRPEKSKRRKTRTLGNRGCGTWDLVHDNQDGRSVFGDDRWLSGRGTR
jgi:hypothetical protein